MDSEFGCGNLQAYGEREAGGQGEETGAKSQLIGWVYLA